MANVNIVSLDVLEFGIAECVFELSKNMKGKISLYRGVPGSCDKEDCVTLKTGHKIGIRLISNKSCDSKIGRLLDGLLQADVVHALNNNGEGRGAHFGNFKLLTNLGVTVSGSIAGITNGGTHRNPLDDCETCNSMGHMEGRISGRVTKGRQPLIGCRLFGSYVIKFDPSVDFVDSALVGTLEGVIVCECKNTMIPNNYRNRTHL